LKQKAGRSIIEKSVAEFFWVLWPISLPNRAPLSFALLVNMTVQQKKILVVDDNKTIRRFIEKILVDEGYQVFLATDGADALRQVSTVKPDLITTDVDMPVMDGYEFCSRLRSGNERGLHPRDSDIPILVITASDTYGAREEWFEAGAADFIVKPIDRAELLKAVTQGLGQSDSELHGLRVLIADSNDILRHLIRQLALRLGVQVLDATNGSQALEMIVSADHPIDLLITDLKLSGLGGLELCRELRKTFSAEQLPIICLSEQAERSWAMEAFSSGASDYLQKPFLADELQGRLHLHLSNLRNFKSQTELVRLLEAKVVERNKRLQKDQVAALHVIANLTENRDPETSQHTQRTQFYVRIILRALAEKEKYRYQLGEDTIEEIVMAAPLHDIGKVGIPDRILLKPGILTNEEFEVMKTHAEIGKRCLQDHEEDSIFFPVAAEIAGGHHEKWDGTGYPQGIRGEAIPLAARAMALADVYDALTMKRVYKEAFSPERAKELIRLDRGKHFDPEMVDVLIDKEADFIEIAIKYADPPG